MSTGLSQPRLADVLGWSQPKVSRIEAGKQRVSVPEVDAWCRATAAPDERRRELLALAEDALVGPTSWEQARGQADLLRSTARIEARAGLISVYQPAILPGLLQTVGYARRVLSAGPASAPSDLAERVLARLERQRILYDERKRLRFVVPEAVLRWPVGPIDEHLEQLDRLAEILARPNVELRILPMAPPLVWRTGGFVLFDELGDEDPFVHLELLTRPVNIDEPDQVGKYQKAFADLLGASAEGKHAKTLLTQVGEDMRRRCDGRVGCVG